MWAIRPDCCTHPAQLCWPTHKACSDNIPLEERTRGSSFSPLTHSAPGCSLLQLCCSHSDKGLAGKSVTSSALALADLPWAAWLISTQNQRVGRAGLTQATLHYLSLIKITLNRTIIHTNTHTLWGSYLCMSGSIFFLSRTTPHGAILSLSLS